MNHPAQHGSDDASDQPLRDCGFVAATLPHPLANTACARPNHPLLVTQEGTWSARALATCVAQRAYALAHHEGVAAGQRVGLIGEPSAAWVIDFFALGWLGAVPVPLAVSATAHEREHAVQVAQVTRVLTVIQTSTSPSSAAWTDQGCGIDPPGVATLPHMPARAWRLDDLCAIVLTSGTSDGRGLPKAIALTVQQCVFSAMGSMIRVGHAHHDRWLACLPLHHIGGLSILLRCVWYGTTIELLPRFDATHVAQRLDSGEVTLVSLVPVMLERILDVRVTDQPFPPAVRAMVVGGAATSARLRARCAALNAPVALSWGMTECASQVATRMPGDLREDGGCGPPMPFVQVDSTTQETLRIMGPVAPQSSQAGAWESSDRGCVDAAGHVHVFGRRDDVMISGGENIAPEEIERVLEAHPDVAEAAVVGMPHATWGERPVAVLVRHGTQSTQHSGDDALRDWCRARLSSFKVPAHFVWVTALPRNRMGKRDKAGLLAVVQGALGAFTQEAHAYGGEQPGTSVGGRPDAV